MSPSDFAKITLRNILTIVLSVLIGTAGAYGIYLLQKPTYVADATAYVTAINMEGGTDSTYTGTLLAKQKVRSFIPVFTSRTTAERAIRDLGLRSRPDEVVQRIAVTAPTDSVAINVRAEGGTPESARALADAIVSAASIEIEQLEGGPTAGVRVVPMASAALPTSPASPILSRFLLMGFLAGLIIGYTIAFVRFRMDTRIRTVVDIEDTQASVVLGTLPADKLVGRDSKEAKEGEKSSFMSREALRKLRTNLRFVSIDNPPRAIVITSSQPKDGKSTVAVRLAQVIAASGTEVLLVDADLRRPTIASSLGLDETVGLSGILTGDVFLDEAVQSTSDKHLHVVAAGQIPPNPSELLGSQRMRDLLAVLKDDYQYVIIDAPPLLQVTDGALLAASADGAIVVVRSGNTRKSELDAAVRHLESVGAPILGTVLNQVNTKRMAKILNGSDHYYGYGYGYSSRYESVVSTSEAKQPAVEDVPFMSTEVPTEAAEDKRERRSRQANSSVTNTISRPLKRSPVVSTNKVIAEFSDSPEVDVDREASHGRD
ncbi:Tyrosine-protein kinase YwqD [Corynebacterium atrinae]|uniref:polysaccharide biosynthesis tyrosine autokinase n=1 Tax=Corynebacterium atrinae TaxID=1336740 RepID=UPI0025B2B6FC|nr:polysaccharide biosynthesis tyrosine autokinase [Corynebacterium atrinae]WJY64420.1 Tyrosine-protein kinase YwqD [Corynebacterium atrinae]